MRGDTFDIKIESVRSVLPAHNLIISNNRPDNKLHDVNRIIQSFWQNNNNMTSYIPKLFPS